MIARGKIIVTALLMLLVTTAYSQTLFTYGTHSVSKDEFIKAFSKNNTEEKPGARSYRDYLDLYINFKLKVQAAHDRKLDTLQKFIYKLSQTNNPEKPTSKVTSKTDLPPEYFTGSLWNKIQFFIGEKEHTASGLLKRLLEAEPKTTTEEVRKLTINLYATLNAKAKNNEVDRRLVAEEFVYYPVSE